MCAGAPLGVSIATLTCSERRPVARLTSITGVASLLFSSDRDCKPVHCRSSTAQERHAESEGRCESFRPGVFNTQHGTTTSIAA